MPRPLRPATSRSGRATRAPKTRRPAASPDKGELVDRLFDDWGGRDSNAPGAAVVVVHEGEVLHQNCYGLADLTPPTPVTPHTVFELASVSKQFTAMAVMVLKERGKLRYSDRLTDYFPTFRAPEARRTTVLDLLNHTSGVPDYEALFVAGNMIDKHYPRSSRADRGRFEPTADDVIDLLSRQYEFDFAPGARFVYSNSGYVLLTKIIEQAARRPFRDFMCKHVFGPLGMRDTCVFDEAFRETGAARIPNAANGHDRGWCRYNEIDYTPLNFICGDGSVRSTIEDLLKWDRAIDALHASPARRRARGAAAAAAGKPVRPETLREAFALSHPTNSLDHTDHTRYCFGWFFGKGRGLRVQWHSGGWGGFRTIIMRFPDQRFTVIALSNVSGFTPSTIASRVATIYLEPLMTPMRRVRVGREVLRRYAKRHYMDPSSAAFSDYYDVTLEDDRRGRPALFVKTSDQEKLRLIPVSAGTFFVEGLFGFDLFRYSFAEDENHQMALTHAPMRPQGARRTRHRFASPRHVRHG